MSMLNTQLSPRLLDHLLTYLFTYLHLIFVEIDIKIFILYMYLYRKLYFYLRIYHIENNKLIFQYIIKHQKSTNLVCYQSNPNYTIEYSYFIIDYKCFLKLSYHKTRGGKSNRAQKNNCDSPISLPQYLLSLLN